MGVTQTQESRRSPPLSLPLGTGHLSPPPAPHAGGPTTVLPDEPSELRDILCAFLTMLGADGATRAERVIADKIH